MIVFSNAFLKHGQTELLEKCHGDHQSETKSAV